VVVVVKVIVVSWSSHCRDHRIVVVVVMSSAVLSPCRHRPPSLLTQGAAAAPLRLVTQKRPTHEQLLAGGVVSEAAGGRGELSQRWWGRDQLPRQRCLLHLVDGAPVCVKCHTHSQSTLPYKVRYMSVMWCQLSIYWCLPGRYPPARVSWHPFSFTSAPSGGGPFCKIDRSERVTEGVVSLGMLIVRKEC
jgi:hypothetical protein